MMKKILSLILILALALSATACQESSSMDAEREAYLEEDTQAIYTSLLASFEEAEETKDLLSAVVAFADDNEIYYRTLSDSIVILIAPAMEGDSDAKEVTLQTSVSLDNAENSASNTAVILSALKNSDRSNRVVAIVTLQEGATYTGAALLPTSYLDTDCFLNITNSNKPRVYMDSAAVEVYEFTRSLTSESISDRKAYTITIEGLPECHNGDVGDSTINPLSRLYKILQWCENNSIDYRVCSFTAGSSYQDLPTSASVTIAINASDMTKFENKVNKLMASFYEDIADTDNADATYTMEQVDLPDTAITADDTTALLGLIYILQNNYDYLNQDEEGTTVGKHEMTYIHVSSTEACLALCSRFSSAKDMDDVNSTICDLAELTGFTVSQSTISPLWEMEEESTLLDTFSTYVEAAGITLKETTSYRNFECGIFLAANPDLPLLTIGIGKDNLTEVVVSLITYIEEDAESAE